MEENPKQLVELALKLELLKIFNVLTGSLNLKEP